MNNEEEMEIRALALIRVIAEFSPPGRDPDDDTETLHSLIVCAKAILALKRQPQMS